MSLDRTEHSNLLDSTDHLKSWGFSASCCMKCKKRNSELDGLLLQCGKCKKAYYCSMNCFNSDLVNHTKFCNTDKLRKDPIGFRSPPLERTITEDTQQQDDWKWCEQKTSKANDEVSTKSTSDDEESFASGDDGSEKDNPPFPGDDDCVDFIDEPTGEIPLDEIVMHEAHDSDSEDMHDYLEEVEEEPTMSEEEVTEEYSESMADENGINEDSSSAQQGRSRYTRGQRSIEQEERNLGRNFKPGKGNLPGSPSYEKEHVNLRHMDFDKDREYSWAKPEWATGSPLRSTPKGSVVKSGGNLSRPVTNIKTVVEKGEIEWQKPAWTKSPPLRTSEKGDILKKEGNLASPVTHIRKVVEEKGHHSWQKPEWSKEPKLRSTKYGSKVKEGKNLGRPITKPARLAHQVDVV